ncbi:hypothetical protein ABT096_39750 [Streptomyces sp. NPDC002561]|uniref:hypothetical protein n=1 Tax=Streptomyces sp. NPDC002561 TaxID=3154418 RepID=UPI003329004C
MGDTHARTPGHGDRTPWPGVVDAALSPAVELAPHGITAGALALGAFRTPIDGAFPFDRDAFGTACRERVPLGCYRVPGENVGAAAVRLGRRGVHQRARIVMDGGVLAERTHRMRFIRPAAYAAYDARLRHPSVIGCTQKET